MTDDAHLGDLLSALLDSELAPWQAEAARAHLASCPVCAAELDAVGTARSWVRELPPVDPPFGLYERLLRSRNRFARAGVAALAAGAAVSIGMVAFSSPRQAPVSPPVARLVDAHAATASVAGDPLSQLVPAATPVSFPR
jgi:putative zinc finger protein